MDNEQILKAAQQSAAMNNEMPEYEKNVARKGILFATMVFSICCIIMVISETIIFKKFDFGKPLLLSLFLCVTEWYEYKKLKKGLAVSIALTVFTVVLLIFYVRGLIV